jgi:hypothetical protein
VESSCYSYGYFETNNAQTFCDVTICVLEKGNVIKSSVVTKRRGRKGIAVR